MGWLVGESSSEEDIPDHDNDKDGQDCDALAHQLCAKLVQNLDFDWSFMLCVCTLLRQRRHCVSLAGNPLNRLEKARRQEKRRKQKTKRAERAARGEPTSPSEKSSMAAAGEDSVPPVTIGNQLVVADDESGDQHVDSAADSAEPQDQKDKGGAAAVWSCECVFLFFPLHSL